MVAYGALLPQSVLDIPPQGWVNLHFSLLPAWRGAAPVQRAILAGDQVTGATTFRIVLELDAGPDLREHHRADPADRHLRRPAGTARGQRGRAAGPQTLDGIEDGTLTAVPQPEGPTSYATKLNVADAEISWAEPADAVDRLIRGCAPAPGAWTTFRGERFKINSARVAASHLPPGCPRGDEVRGAGRHRPPGPWSWVRCRRRARSRWPPPTGPAGSASTASRRSAPDASGR